MNSLLRANLKFYWRRYLATALAVLIAVVFVVAVLVLRDGINASMSRGFAQQYQGAAAVIVPTGEADPTQKLGSVDEVALTAPVSQAFAEFNGNSQGMVAALLPEPFAQPTVLEGTLPSAANEIALDKRQADALEAVVGDVVGVLPYVDGRTEDYVVSGIIGEPDGVLLGGNGPDGVVLPGEGSAYVSEYLVAGAPGYSQEEVAAAVSQALEGSGFEIMTAEERIDQSLADFRLSSAQTSAVLMVFPAIAAVMAVIVISTTFQVLIQQRRREIGLLRCVGASTKQVRGFLLGETLAVGAAASALGVLVGSLLSAWAITALGFVGSFSEAVRAISWVPLVIVFVVATAVTLLAGLRPAAETASLPPLVVFSGSDEVGIQRTAGWWVRLIIGAIIMLGAGSGMVWASYQASPNGLLIAMALGPVTLVGLALFMWSAFPEISGWVAALWRGTIGRLAAGNARRTPGRTAATGVSMVIGVSLIVMMMVGAASVRLTLNSELDSWMSTDLTVTGTDLDAELIGEVDGVAKVAAEEGLPQGGTIGDDPVVLYDVSALQNVARTELQLPGDDQVLVSPAYGAGETLNVCALDSCRELQALVDTSYTAEPGRAGLSQKTFTELTRGQDVETVQILARLEDTSNYSSVVAELKELNPNWTLAGSASLRAQFDQVINVLLTAMVALLGVSVLVALVGVSNTLSLSVAERTRELGLLRALGMTKRQVSRMLTTEALQVSLTAGLIGTLAGIFFGWVGTVAVIMDIGTTRLAIPWLQLGVVILVTMGAAALASWLPGRRAGKTSPTEALAVI